MEDTKSLFLTFDDGPSPATPAILEILKKYGVTATFFMCGKNIERYPGIAKLVVAGGHAIGNHAYSHSLIRTVSGYRMSQEIRTTNAIIGNILGLSPAMFRAPWGIINPVTGRTATALQYRMYGWNTSAVDWIQIFMPYRFMKYRFRRGIKPGAIFLLHDGHATSANPWRKKTVRLVSEMIPLAKEQGYEFRPLPIPNP